jgi:hypothetical protein
MKLYGLHGKKQSGKDTFANFATELLQPHGFTVARISLARPLKQFCVDYLGIPECNVFGNDFEKNQWVGTWSIFAEHLRDKYKKPTDEPICGREILQVVGTDIIRENFGADYWIRLLRIRLDKAEQDDPHDRTIVFVTDVRFPNEMEAIHSWGGKVIKIYRNIKRENQIEHASENAMDVVLDEEYDYVVYGDANRTMAQLKQATNKILYKEELYDI